MDPENILKSLLYLLPLDQETVKYVHEVFQVILIPCGNSSSSSGRKRTPTSTDIEDTAAKLREVIAFFDSADEERDEFIDIFPVWEVKRKNNIQKLRQTAESMQESRQICSVAQIVGGGVGVVGGAAIIGSILFPPAAPALLPAWLGGAATTALIPSFLLPAAATAVTSSLAVGGTIVAGAGGVAKVVTSVTEAALLSSQIDKAKDICHEDKKSFDRMMVWFEHTHQLKSALDELFDINILEIILRDLKDYFGQCNLGSMAFRYALQSCVKKTLGHGLFNPSIHIAVIAITFTVFLIRRRNRFLFQWIIVGFGLVAAFNAAPQIGRLVASSVMKESHLIPKALASKVAVGALAGISIALDVANIVLNSIDLVEGSKSEVQEKVLEVAEELEKNLDFIRDVHRKLLNAAKKLSEDFLNSLVVDQLGMKGTVTIIAHEVYQDALQVTHKLKKSGKLSGRKFDDQRKDSLRSFCQMDPYLNSLRKVIDYFNAADKDREIFCNYFCQWEKKRKENITLLHSIAESLQEVRTLGSVAQYVGGTKGAVGIGAGLLQRSQRVFDTVIVTCKAAINNSNATRLIAQLRKRIEKTGRICKQDRDDFIKLDFWFRRVHELNSAFDKLFGRRTFDTIFMDLKVVCGGGLHKYRGSTYNYTFSKSPQESLESCISKILKEPLRIDPSFQEAAIAVVFAVLLDGRRNMSHLNCFDKTRLSRFMQSRFAECSWAFNECTDTVFTENTDKEEAFLKSLEISLVEGRVAFLDTINTVLKLANTDEAEFRALAGELQGELDSMTEIYRKLR